MNSIIHLNFRYYEPTTELDERHNSSHSNSNKLVLAMCVTTSPSELDEDVLSFMSIDNLILIL